MADLYLVENVEGCGEKYLAFDTGFSINEHPKAIYLEDDGDVLWGNTAISEAPEERVTKLSITSEELVELLKELIE